MSQRPFVFLDDDDEDDGSPLEGLGWGSLEHGVIPAATSCAARASFARRYLEEGSGRQKRYLVLVFPRTLVQYKTYFGVL